MNLTQPRTLQKTVYSGVRLAERVRWNVAAEYKPVFDTEGDPLLWDAPIEVRAKAAGVEVVAYERALEAFERMPVVRLGIVVMRAEGDFLQNWWVNLKSAEKLARELAEEGVKTYRGKDGKTTVTDNRAQAIKALLMVEREKMMGIKRLVETGRMIDPSEYSKERVKKRKKEPKFEPGKTGFIDID